MSAQTLRCPGCGAPAQSDAPACAHCRSRLATVGCPACFGMMFVGSKHCPHCGTRADRSEPGGPADALACPRCTSALGTARVGDVTLHDCHACGGVWLDAETFHSVTAGREVQAAVLAFAPPQPPPTPESTVRYAACPCCGTMMSRVNFARISGVVLDTCRAHGTWFDRDELRRIVEFVRGGGLEASRERERIKLEDERRRLEQMDRGSGMVVSGLEATTRTQRGDGEELVVTVIRFLGLGL